ncbi:hypothetical protein EVAR_65446_1 [Eumeta japonica]|uniref:Uncharacterized protein n=1 Tax=Eumeta variegata TaxID=151549 RepID=A0A4C1ZDM9_EUMVA|nr:hypothetical protein EVAR_65446_1 [Eumeta japonica]
MAQREPRDRPGLIDYCCHVATIIYLPEPRVSLDAFGLLHIYYYYMYMKKKIHQNLYIRLLIYCLALHIAKCWDTCTCWKRSIADEANYKCTSKMENPGIRSLVPGSRPNSPLYR